MNVSDREMQLAVPLDIYMDATWGLLPLDPGKDDKAVFQWCVDMEGLLNRNREEIYAHTKRNGPDLQERLAEMAERMKNMWAHASEDQRATWIELKETTFGANELHTKLLDVICSFESRWIPQEHCPCPICWEGGQSQKFSNLPDFVNHMKNTHHIGWKNVKDYWCMIFSRALEKTVFRTCKPDNPGKPELEMMNAFAWCPYPKCKHTHDKGGTFLRHFEKDHQSKSVPSMGIWAAMTERIRQQQDVSVDQFLGEKSGYICSNCGHFGVSQRALEDHVGMKHRAGEADVWPCHAQPAIRPGEGEGDDPSLKQKVDALVEQTKPKHGEWSKEEAEETGRRWHRMIMEQWHQGVQEKQTSRAEAKWIRKDGSFPMFIKESILPTWKAWKGVSFQAIQGLCEMSIQMQRSKMK
jgi:hypothetical protein